MKTSILTLTLMLLCFTATHAQDFPQQKIESKIEHVTVFLNGAQVKRAAKVSIPKGKSEIILRGLTPSLETQSVVVKGDGDFTILSVKPQMNFLDEQRRKDTIIALENQKEAIWETLLRDSTEVLVLHNEEEILYRNRVQVVGIQQTNTKPEDLTNLIEIQKKRLKDIYDRKFELQKIANQRRREMAKLTAQLSELNARKSTVTAEIVVTVVAKNNPIPNANLQLEYLVPNTNWYPTYDIRVQNTQEPMLTQMKAKVRQNSGEDWREVKLTLSTGEPKRTGVKPELGTWYLGSNGYGYILGQSMNDIADIAKLKDINQKNLVQGVIRDGETGEPLIGASVVVKGTTNGSVTDIDGRFSLEVPVVIAPILVVSYVGYAAIETSVKAGSFSEINLKGNNVALNEVVVTGYGRKSKNDATGAVSTISERELQGRVASADVKDTHVRGASNLANKPVTSVPLSIKEEQKQTTTSFDIELPYTIPTNGKEHQVDIKEMTMPATYQYACVPKMDADAFLTAEVLDWEKHNLMEGEANLYFEGTYLGKSLLKTNDTDDTLRISLGRDKNVVIKRTKLKDFGRNKILSNKRHEARGFEITIKNKKNYPLSIVIEEQIPVSKDKQIDVEHKADGAIYDKEKGRLTWKIDLKPLEDKKLVFSYEVKYPADWGVDLE
jgi:hypothetical protein